MAKYSQAQNKAVQKYKKINYDQISIRVKKGKREEYNRIAAAAGKSLAALFVELIEDYGRRQNIRIADQDKDQDRPEK